MNMFHFRFYNNVRVNLRKLSPTSCLGSEFNWFAIILGKK